jgi:PAS domain S-box-containing protein
MGDNPKSKSQLLRKKSQSGSEKTRKSDEIYLVNNNFQSLFNALPYIILFLDKKGIVLNSPEASPSQLLPLKTPNEIIGKTIYEVFPGMQADYFLDNLKKTIKKRHAVSFEYKLNIDGNDHWFSVTLSPVDKNCVIALIHDITNRKNIEDTDKKSLQLFRLVWENSNDGMRLTNSQGKILMVNKAFCRLMEKSRLELEGEPLTVVYGREFKNQAPLIHKEKFDGVGLNSYYEYEVTLWNDKIIWLGISSSFFEIENEEPYLLSIFNNITERKLDEVKINQALSLLNATLESTADGILVVDLNGNITGLNQKFIKMWNIPPELVSSKKESDIQDFLKDTLKEPDTFTSRITWLREYPEVESIDSLEFKDGRIFERYSIPQKLNDTVVGRVWSFRDITEKRISEEALIESEKRFRSLFEASAEGICIISDRYEECNARLCNLFNCPKEEIIGFAPWEFSPEFQPDGKFSKESILEKINLAHMGVPQYFYWQHKRKNNSLIDTEVSLKNFIVGKRNLVQATIHDITERKRFEKIQNALYKISESVNTTEDMQTLYSDIHEVIKELMAADNFYIALYDEKQDVLTFPYFVDEFDHAPIPRKPANGLTEYVLKTGKDLIITDEEDLELRRKGAVELIGEPAAVWLGVVLKHEGHVRGVMAVQDYYNKNAFGEIEKQILVFVSEQITLAIDRKRTSEELIIYTKQLKENKDLLEERASQLVKLNAQLAESESMLKELNASKDKLFSIIAHDLKGPFQPLLGLSDILLEEFDNLTAEEKSRFIFEINNILKNQYKLVENLLDWSRLQTGRMIYNPEKTNLYETVESNYQMFRPKSASKKITLINEVPKNIFIFADVYMLQSIVQNLISNALKFTKSGGSITVSAESINNLIKISFIDTGIGISQNDLDKIFKIDKQHTTLGTEDEKGTGLGLIICKELIEKNNGEIWIESEINKGTKFFVTLPSS